MISKTDTQMPEGKQTPTASTNTPVNAPFEPTVPHPKPAEQDMQKRNRMPVSDKRKPLGSSFYTRSQNDKRKKFNVYATTRDGCETKLAEMIEYVKIEIAEKKPKIE